MRRFNPAELKQYLADCETSPLLLDVREPWEFEKCRIEGSILIPMRQVPTTLEELEPDQATVVICHHGIRSRQVCFFLEQQGFSNVINLEGGVEAWAQDVDSDMPRY